MTKELFLSQLDRIALVFRGLPVSGALARHLAAVLKQGDPAWWPQVLKSWEKRQFVAWSEAASLFLSAVHYEALSDTHNPLARCFPSCGGTPAADLAPALDRFLAETPSTFYENLRNRHRRTFSAQLSTLWMFPANLFFQRKRMLPFYLVEVNAGAGLNLAADAVTPDKRFDSDLIEARIGLDPDPLSLSDIDQRRWLTAALWPDDMNAIMKMDQAADVVLARVSQDPSFIQLVPCPQELAPRFIAKNIPAEADVGLLIFNMGATVRMTDEEYAAFRTGMAETLKPWGDRALWVEVESVRGEIHSTTIQLRVHRFKDGVFQQNIVYSRDFATRKVRLDMQIAEQFLAV